MKLAFSHTEKRRHLIVVWSVGNWLRPSAEWEYQIIWMVIWASERWRILTQRIFQLQMLDIPLKNFSFLCVEWIFFTTIWFSIADNPDIIERRTHFANLSQLSAAANHFECWTLIVRSQGEPLNQKFVTQQVIQCATKAACRLVPIIISFCLYSVSLIISVGWVLVKSQLTYQAKMSSEISSIDECWNAVTLQL